MAMALPSPFMQTKISIKKFTDNVNKGNLANVNERESYLNYKLFIGGRNRLFILKDLLKSYLPPMVVVFMAHCSSVLLRRSNKFLGVVIIELQSMTRVMTALKTQKGHFN